MVNLIYLDGSEHKMARPVKNREEYVALRNAPENVKNFYDARSGDEKAKGRQVQFCYNDLLPDRVLKGCCHPSSTFAHDIDCDTPEEQERIKQILIAKKDEILADYEDQEKWRRMMLVNISKAGYFSSDRTIADYNKDIWNL